MSLFVNGKAIATQKANIPANGRAKVEFTPLNVGYGFNRCEVRIEGGDAFPADDTSVFAVRRSDPERVLFVHANGDMRSAFYFQAALGAAAQASYVLQSVAAEQVTGPRSIEVRFRGAVGYDDAALYLRAHACPICRLGWQRALITALGTSAAHHARIPLWAAIP